MKLIQPVAEYFKTPGNAAPGVAGVRQSGVREHGYDATAATQGPSTNFFMEQTLWAQHEGARNYSFLDDFYFRFYAIPSELAYGTFSQDTVKSVRIWNAYFDDAALSSAVATIGEEITFDQVAELPLMFGGLEERLISFTASGDGDTVLSDEVTLTFQIDGVVQTILLPVSGFRVPQLTDIVFPFPPNWSEELEMEFEFKSEVIRSANGREQRTQLRQTPRKSFRFGIAMDNTKRLEYRRLMTVNQRGRFYVPELPRFVTTTEAMSAEDITVRVDQTPPWWLIEKDNFVILSYGKRYSLRKIDRQGSDSNSETDMVYFKSDDEYEWPAGTKIHPAISSWVSDETQGALLTNYVQTSDMRFLGVPGLEAIEPPSTPLHTFDDRELWLEKPNWGNNPGVQDMHPTIFLDAGVGRVDREVDQDFQRQIVALSYTASSFEEFEVLRKFIYRCAGQVREFYMPTWQPDIFPSQGWIAGDDQIIVDGIDFAAVYADDPVRNGGGVALILHSGQIVYKRVSDIFAETDSSGGYSVLQLSEIMGQDIALEEVEKVCWMPLWRFAIDTFTFTWLTNAVCEVNFVMQTQPWEPKDGDDESNSEIV